MQEKMLYKLQVLWIKKKISIGEKEKSSNLAILSFIGGKTPKPNTR